MRTNDLLVAISHSTSHICSTFVTSLIATKYEKCRTSTQRIRTSANVEGHLLLHYFNFCQHGHRGMISKILRHPTVKILRVPGKAYSSFPPAVRRDVQQPIALVFNLCIGGIRRYGCSYRVTHLVSENLQLTWV